MCQGHHQHHDYSDVMGERSVVVQTFYQSVKTIEQLIIGHHHQREKYKKMDVVFGPGKQCN